MSDRFDWPTHCMHGTPLEQLCAVCDDAGRTNVAEYGAYEPLIRPERVRLLEAILDDR